MTSPLTSPPAPVPLSPEQLLELQKAKLRAKKIRRAAGVSRIDGFITSFFAAGALLSGICGDLSAFLLGVAMAWVAFRSFRGAARMGKIDLRSPKTLAGNQALLFASITLYALYNWHHGTLDDILRQIIGDPSILTSMPQIADAAQTILQWGSPVFYGSVILGSLLAQGLAALYYLTRRSVLEAYVESTPPWILELQRRGLA